VITLQDGGGSAPTDMAGPMAPEMSADSGSRLAMGGADMAYWPGYGGRTVFTASGLSEEGGSAPAWAFDPAKTFNQETVTRLAAAFGVAGAPVLTDGYWIVGPNDGTGPNVTLNPDGTGSAGFYDPTKDPWSCQATVDGVAPDAGTLEQREADPSVGIAPEPCTQRDLGAAPQGEAATGQAADLLTALGLDPAGFELVVEEYGDTQWSYVTGYQVIDGQRTGVTMSFSFTGAGLQSFYGSLAPVVSLGEYAVISPAEAVDRLTDPRFGGGWGGPIAYVDGAGPRGGDMATSSEPSMPSTPTVPSTPAAGSAISWPVNQVTIVEARLGTAMHTQADGATVLLPTYELIGSDGGIWSVIAVDDAHLDFSSGR
jgi:hypothetical protein